MLRGNKGEWGEPYVALKLIGDGRLYIADEQGNKKPIELGHFFIVINPEFFMGEEILRKTTGEICRQLRASKKAPGATRIYTAGEKEYLSYMECKDKGVPLGISVQKEFLDIRDRYHLDYHFPFEDE